MARVMENMTCVSMIDLKLPDMDGLEVMREIKRCIPGAESIESILAKFYISSEHVEKPSFSSSSRSPSAFYTNSNSKHKRFNFPF